MGTDSWEIIATCIAYLQKIPIQDVLFHRWDGVAQVRELLLQLKAKIPNALKNVPDVALVVSALEMQLRDIHCRNDMIFPPQYYEEFVNFGCAVGQSKEESIAWMKALYAKTPQPYRNRVEFMLKFLHSQWDESNMDKMMYIVEKYAPLLLRDAKSAFMSLHHTDGFTGTTECLLFFLQHYEQRNGGVSPLEMNHCLDELIQDTVFTTLFKPFTTPQVLEKETLAAIRIQSIFRGWKCRRWSCLQILFSTRSLPKAFRQYYLNLTKRVLQWSLEKLLGEKKRLKHQLQAFDKTFFNMNYRPPTPLEKKILRPLYEMYHFLRIIVDYQQQNDKDPTCFQDFMQTATTKQLKAYKEKHQMQLLLFERHFYLCCGEMVQQEEDYGHIIQQYMQYKTLSSKLAETA
ncbi:hypothetical protein THRCLA_10608 [Thraustotheca clavata]|uniref:Rho-GAP domain-containing protein n=1 Tax=Thraustotheca clavata TaxID=74557 RepID=A0A1V9YJM0_9STRA|nr:hypothetical protein THRCLA_10608 [Thraustotheca clavata]